MSGQENPLTENEEYGSQCSRRESGQSCRKSMRAGVNKINKNNKRVTTGAGGGSDVVEEYNLFFKSAIRMSGMRVKEYKQLKS